MARWAKIILPALVVLACSSDLYYKEKITIGNELWLYDEPIEFSVEISDTMMHYDIVLDVEHSPKYHAQNLYVNIKTEYPDKTSREQVLSMEMADKSGKWFGDCNSKKCLLSLMLQNKARFNQIGTHHISISQHSRQDSISGIQALNLSLFESPSL